MQLRTTVSLSRALPLAPCRFLNVKAMNRFLPTLFSARRFEGL
jgi:hypothetical protein